MIPSAMGNVSICTPHRQRFRSLGATFDIAGSSPVLLALAVGALPPLCLPSTAGTARRVFRLRAAGPCRCGGVHPSCDVFAGRTRAAQADDTATALGELRAAVKLWVGTAAPRHVFVHAGVVGWGGRAVLLPGRRGAGKTTLVRAFLDRGASYLSDDMAVIDGHGRVWPYPLPLSVREVDADLSVSRTPQRDVPASAFGARTEPDALPVGAVVVAHYVRRPEGVTPVRWTPATVSAGATVLKVLEHVVGVRRRPVFTLEAVSRAVQCAAVRIEGLRSEPGDVVADVCARLDAD